MASEYTPCAYHPKKVAVTTCTRCKRAICLEDKRVFTTSSSSNYQSFDYCVVCYASRLKSNSHLIVVASLFAFIIPVFIVGSMFMDGTQVNTSDILSFVFFIGIFFFAFYLSYSISKKKAITTEKDANEFIYNLEDKSLLVTTTVGNSQEFDHNSSFSSFKNHQLVCFECGSYITRKTNSVLTVEILQMMI